MKRKKENIILLPADFCPEVSWTDLPFLVERSLPALLQLGSKDALIYSLLNLVTANLHFSIDADCLIET